MFKVHDSLLSALRTPNGKTIIRILILVQLKITSKLILEYVNFSCVFLIVGDLLEAGFKFYGRHIILNRD